MTGARRARALLVVAALVGSVAVPMATVGAAQTETSPEAYVTVSNVSVSPQNPTPGERVTVTAEFRNSESSTGAVEITQAVLRGPSVRSSARNLGDLGPGDTVDVPFSIRFDEPGQKRLTVIFRGHAPSGAIVIIERPVYVDVERSGDVSLAFSTVFDTDPAAGATTPVNVTVANGDSEAITGVELVLGGDGTVEDPRRISGSVAGGAERTYGYDVTFDGVGTRTLTGEVTYTTSAGITRTTAQSVDVTVVEPSVEADLSARASDDRAGETVVELTNFGNTEFTDVEVTATANGEVVGRTLVADVEPDSSRSVSFDVASAVDGRVTYTATYTAAGTTHETSVRDRSAVSGEIRLVSVETSRLGGGVTIEGEAANIGSTTAESVLLSVVDGDGVRPTAPTGEYYVGEVEGSEFGTFELTADTADGATAVPVEITYVVDGDRVTTTQRIDLSATSSGGQAPQDADGRQGSSGGPDGGGGGLPLTAIGIALALVALGGVGVAVYRWRNR